MRRHSNGRGIRPATANGGSTYSGSIVGLLVPSLSFCGLKPVPAGAGIEVFLRSLFIFPADMRSLSLSLENPAPEEYRRCSCQEIVSALCSQGPSTNPVDMLDLSWVHAASVVATAEAALCQQCRTEVENAFADCFRGLRTVEAAVFWKATPWEKGVGGSEDAAATVTPYEHLAKFNLSLEHKHRAPLSQLTLSFTQALW